MWSVFAFLIIASANFITLFIFRMRMEMMKATVKKHWLCFKCLSCCRVKDRNAFMNEHQVDAL